MKRPLLLTLALLAAAPLLFGLWVYAASEWRVRSYPRPAPFAMAIPTDAASLARGEHLVRTRGCRGCHGARFEGELQEGAFVAVNLTRYVREESLATFEAALRHGIGRDGRAFYSMPAYNFRRLRDADVAAIYAWLRTQPVVEQTLPAASLPWPVRYDIALGRDGPVAQFLPGVPPLREQANSDARSARGEYLAMTSCNECHGFNLRADFPWPPWPDGSGPDLIVLMGYDEAAFRHLMSTGKAIGERELPMMSGVARTRFAYLTEEEVSDLWAFLRRMAEQAAGQSAS
jgi:mono/diheme cytochrome c family protein